MLDYITGDDNGDLRLAQPSCHFLLDKIITE
jgi:hypothetical protein